MSCAVWNGVRLSSARVEIARLQSQLGILNVFPQHSDQVCIVNVNGVSSEFCWRVFIPADKQYFLSFSDGDYQQRRHLGFLRGGTPDHYLVSVSVASIQNEWTISSRVVLSKDKEMETCHSLQRRLDSWENVPPDAIVSKQVVSGMKILRDGLDDVYDMVPTSSIPIPIPKSYWQVGKLVGVGIIFIYC